VRTCGHDGGGYILRDYIKAPTICTRPAGHDGKHSCEVPVRNHAGEPLALVATIVWGPSRKLGT